MRFQKPYTGTLFVCSCDRSMDEKRKFQTIRVDRIVGPFGKIASLFRPTTRKRSGDCTSTTRWDVSVWNIEFCVQSRNPKCDIENRIDINKYATDRWKCYHQFKCGKYFATCLLVHCSWDCCRARFPFADLYWTKQFQLLPFRCQ